MYYNNFGNYKNIIWKKANLLKIKYILEDLPNTKQEIVKSLIAMINHPRPKCLNTKDNIHLLKILATTKDCPIHKQIKDQINVNQFRKLTIKNYHNR